MSLWGGIEAGGTKFVCAIGSGPDDIRAETSFPTTTPEETIGRAIAFFGQHQQAEPLTAVGIASFGPVDPDRRSATFGYVTTTPKPHWAEDMRAFRFDAREYCYYADWSRYGARARFYGHIDTTGDDLLLKARALIVHEIAEGQWS